MAGPEPDLRQLPAGTLNAVCPHRDGKELVQMHITLKPMLILCGLDPDYCHIVAANVGVCICGQGFYSLGYQNTVEGGGETDTDVGGERRGRTERQEVGYVSDHY